MHVVCVTKQHSEPISLSVVVCVRKRYKYTVAQAGPSFSLRYTARATGTLLTHHLAKN